MSPTSSSGAEMSSMALTKAVEPVSGTKVRTRTSESTGRTNSFTTGDDAVKLWRRSNPPAPTWKRDAEREGSKG
uniref:Uncharacterized protein n=1 Tax=Arundo donax TaxID=35708 RepID=A0A0A9DLF2_ARUDO